MEDKVGDYPVQDELNLVHRARQGDKEAFTRLYESHFERIYRYVAIKLSNRIEAEDVTQQVFVRAYESIGSFKYQGFPFSSWLFRIAHNQVVDYIRRSSKRPEVQLDETMPIAGTSDPVHDVEVKMSMKKVAAASRHLTKAQQEVISLRFAGGLSIAEAAKAMNKSEGAIKALQFSAIQALRKTLATGEPGDK